MPHLLTIIKRNVATMLLSIGRDLEIRQLNLVEWIGTYAEIGPTIGRDGKKKLHTNKKCDCLDKVETVAKHECRKIY